MTDTRRAPPAEPAAQIPAQRWDAASLKLAFMGLAGASIEWYDFFLYAAAAALVFPHVFFPASLPPYVALVASFSTYAVGFVARPLGAMLFGHTGDRLGRKRALAAALIVMGGASTLIGLLPPYSAIGVFAPLTLVLLRFVQGLAVGGQWGGAILLATENAPQSKRGLYGSIVQTSVPVGVILANVALLAANGATSAAGFMQYGWRIPFLFSLGLIGLGFYIHFRVDDTAAYRRLREAAAAQDSDAAGRRRSPIFEALRSHPKLILIAAGAYMSTNLTFYILLTYLVAYATSPGIHVPRGTMLTAELIATAAAAPVTFLAGRLSDRHGRRRVFMCGVGLMGLWSFALFPLIDTGYLPWITAAIFVGACLNSLAYGPLAAMFTEYFGTRVRYSGASLTYQISAILGGGLAPIVATLIYAAHHSTLGVSIYMAAICALSLACATQLKETRAIDLNGEPGVAAAG